MKRRRYERREGISNGCLYGMHSVFGRICYVVCGLQGNGRAGFLIAVEEDKIFFKKHSEMEKYP